MRRYFFRRELFSLVLAFALAALNLTSFAIPAGDASTRWSAACTEELPCLPPAEDAGSTMSLLEECIHEPFLPFDGTVRCSVIGYRSFPDDDLQFIHRELFCPPPEWVR